MEGKGEKWMDGKYINKNKGWKDKWEKIREWLRVDKWMEGNM